MTPKISNWNKKNTNNIIKERQNQVKKYLEMAKAYSEFCKEHSLVNSIIGFKEFCNEVK